MHSQNVGLGGGAVGLAGETAGVGVLGLAGNDGDGFECSAGGARAATVDGGLHGVDVGTAGTDAGDES